MLKKVYYMDAIFYLQNIGEFSYHVQNNHNNDFQ